MITLKNIGIGNTDNGTIDTSFNMLPKTANNFKFYMRRKNKLFFKNTDNGVKISFIMDDWNKANLKHNNSYQLNIEQINSLKTNQL